MASDYSAIRAENKGRYGTDVTRYGQVLLADRYDDPSHFIFELLQNAEDALGRRKDGPKSRTVDFSLSDDDLCVTHYGKPFDTADVKAICGIARGTKQEDTTQIGRFGIGFKSVYSVTDRPIIYSGSEEFAIESFVLPVAAPSVHRPSGQTVFVMPLKNPAIHSAHIATKLQGLGLDTLLFLRQIDTIRWTGPGGGSGVYRRKSKSLCDDPCVRRVTVICKSTIHDRNMKERYMIFSKPMYQVDDVSAGHIEVAFRLKKKKNTVVPMSPSFLVAFFPTAVETHLEFRVQGPYRTTLGRDNIPPSDDWNQRCVESTGDVLVEALVWLRDNDLLDANVLSCLPIDQRKCHNPIFSPLYNKVKQALATRRLLPVRGGGYMPSPRVKSTLSPGLRDLFEQLDDDTSQPLHWLSDDITNRSTFVLRQYLRTVHDVTDVKAGQIIRRLDAADLERRPDDWIRQLYEFMNTQRDLHSKARNWPLVRLDCGKHVQAWQDDQLQAYLPGRPTEYPTVRPSVCSTDASRQFLGALGLTEPDLVDDIIRNVLPKYADEPDVESIDYAGDIQRILTAFESTSDARRKELVSKLKSTPFLIGVDAKSGKQQWAEPGDIYVKTDRLGKLFEGIDGILFACTGDVMGDNLHGLLEECGVATYLRYTLKRGTTLDEDALQQLRKKAGLEACTREDIVDVRLRDLYLVLLHIDNLTVDDRQDRAMAVWEALGDLIEQAPDAFTGVYFWKWGSLEKTNFFDAEFLRILQNWEWVPAGDGEFRKPSEVSFDTLESLGWRRNALLESKIQFRSPAIDQLAEKTEINVDVIYELKKLGLTSVEELRKNLKDPKSEPVGHETTIDVDVVYELKKLGLTNVEGLRKKLRDHESEPVEYETTEIETGAEPDLVTDRGHTGPEREYEVRRDAADRPANRSGVEGERRNRGDRAGGGGQSGTQDRAGQLGRARQFVSYVAVGREAGGDPDGLDQEKRMELESRAIDIIIERDPEWQRTPRDNPGFDLFKATGGEQHTWCEVKAMSGDLGTRPVSLSRKQFRCAQKHGSRYWLYIVERTGRSDARIVRIQDPAGKAETFTFDKGWLAVAEIG